MFVSRRTLALVLFARTVHCQYNCPSGYADKANDPKCAGLESKTCTRVGCCDKTNQLCSDFSAAWVISQALDQGCAADKKFFDRKKLDKAVAKPAGTGQVKTACCTPFVDAKCSDWQLVLGSCDAGTEFKGTNSAPPDHSNGKTLSRTKYKELCCEAELNTCSSVAVAWVISQGFGQGCAVDNKFFDTKKMAVSVDNTADDDSVKAACCTPFADAKCSDWAAVLGVCDSGRKFVGTNNAPPDNSDGKTLSRNKYKELCCEVEPRPCSSVAFTWAAAQILGKGCAQDDKFFDLKKGSVKVDDIEDDARIKGACCTPFSDAKCVDWVGKPACGTGKVRADGNSAPPDNGNDLSSNKYKELCCVEPMLCADYGEDADSAFQRTAFLFTFVGIFALIEG